MIPRTAAEIAAATGGRVALGDAAARANGISIDSRTIQPGELFCAIAGERHDGHDHAAEAVRRGAPIVLAQRALENLAPAALVLVGDTTAALGALALDERRRRAGLKLLAVTGSSGKTTTRALAAAALAARYRTAASAGNLNNQWGLPLSMLRLADDAEAAVVELGMNHPGEIATLARLVEPDIGVITNIGTAHIGFFADQRGLAAAKVELLQEMPRGATGVVHAGSPHLLELARATARRLVTFDLQPPADLVATGLGGSLLEGTRFTVEGVPVRLALWGRHAALNALAALGAARAAGVPLAEAAPRLAALEPQPGRGRIVRLAGGVVLVDETYNSNPSALEAVLAGLAGSPWSGRRVAVIGDMLELGERSAEFHREAGARAAGAGIEVLHAVGGFAAEIAAGARAAGMSRLFEHRDAPAAAGALPDLVNDGDLVLLKGSRGVRLESVLAALVSSRGEQVRP
ncbi:MAG: UDP-N-acetylmuramoyl-tripeptide--D-alanyl-D-alanine ligase [Acidobacteria bacterium]|nr:UDP-N-acetylmuramoyl-tripeptide--D-alanyl-D-alanine ligase [Acidobacteriota bacterium]